MDETQQTVSDVAAAATRKRRSSILKSQRPPRTPFSELEFHVATPTDTAKSRRVSFSKRTGVAEFITHEATTTWRNFYEEHNKSLESSGNESGVNPPKPTIGHLGKRIFEQQFQEVEAVDFITSLDNHSDRNINTSLNKATFTQQLASLECTVGEKTLLNPQPNLEMSTFTDHQSNVFGEDFAIPTMNELSAGINVNFSAVQAIGSSRVKDDLDEIEEDLRRVKSNVVCHGPFNDRRDLSEYIEVELNSTNVAVKIDESDMSITDTIHSPKVQEVSKRNSTTISKNIDWVEDKENIAVYEGCSSAAKSITDKRKSIVYDNDTDNISFTQALPVNIFLSEEGKIMDKRKTILYESDSADVSITQAVPINIMIVNKDIDKGQTINYATKKISIAQIGKRNAIEVDENIADASITPTKENSPPKPACVSNEVVNKFDFEDESGSEIIVNSDSKAKVISSYLKVETNEIKSLMDDLVKPDADVMLFPAISKDLHVPKNPSISSTQVEVDLNSTRVTMRNNESDMSITSTIHSPKAKEVSKSNLTKISKNIHRVEDKENIDVYEGCTSSTKSITEKRKSVVYDNDISNISFTQALPVNIFLTDQSKVLEKRKTVIFESDSADISVTQAVPVNIMIVNKDKDKCKTIIYDTKNISMAQAKSVGTNESIADAFIASKEENSSPKPAHITNEVLKTFHLEDESGSEMSVKSDMKSSPLKKITLEEFSYSKDSTDKIVPNYLKDETDEIKSLMDHLIKPNADEMPFSAISVGDHVPTNPHSCSTHIEIDINSTHLTMKNDEFDIPITDTIQRSKAKDASKRNSTEISNNIDFLEDKKNIDVFEGGSSSIKSLTEERESKVYENDKSNISITQALPVNIFLTDHSKVLEKRKTIIYESESTDISVTQAVPVNIMIGNKDIDKDKTFIDESKDISIAQASLQKSMEVDESIADTSITPMEENLLSKPAHVSNDVVQKFHLENESRSVKSDIKSSPLNKIAFDAISYTKDSKDKVIPSYLKDMSNEIKSLMDDLVKPNADVIPFSASSKGHHVFRNPNFCSTRIETDLNPTHETMKNDESDMSIDTIHSPIAKEVSESNSTKTNTNINWVEDSENIAVHKGCTSSAKSITEKWKSRVQGNDTNNISITQALPVNILLTEQCKMLEKRKTIIYESESADISVTQAVPVNILLLSNDRDEDKTIVYEDNNVSMSQAAVQQSTETDESITDTSITPTEENSLPKPARVSNEVVKKLHFEDESGSETSVKSDTKSSPLKKIALKDISYSKDSKAKVIPSYLTDVSDEIKSLMDDLVKPNADVMPFSAISRGHHVPRNPSTCSTQIQANLVTSSQIDVNTEELNSATTSSYNLANSSCPSFNADPKPKKSSLKSSEAEKVDNLKEAIICPKLASPSSTLSDRVIIFDQNNPLNNVLLVPPDYSNVHRYQPELNGINELPSRSNPIELEETASDIEHTDGTKVTQYNVESVLLCRAKGGDMDILDTVESSLPNASKWTSAPDSMRVRELKDTKVNTLIAMKQNKELLETSSSLTLVDEALTANNFNTALDNASDDNRIILSDSKTNSPIKLIYNNVEQVTFTTKDEDSNLTSNDETGEPDKITNKGKKRNYSPTKRDKHKQSGRSSLDNTPKQISKMQKLSTSPYQPEKGIEKLEAEKDATDENSKMEIDKNVKNISPKFKLIERKQSPSNKNPGLDITVQQLITEYGLHGNIDQDNLNKHIIKALSISDSSSVQNAVSTTDLQNLEIVSSFTSSKNQIEMRDACSVTTTDTKSSARSSRTDWQPEANVGSAMISNCDSSVNVVAKIDMLPFMGSHECEWEPSGSDTWVFRLLHARLRLTIRLAHRHDNATRTRVRADTPVLSVSLDIAQSDNKNSVATLCVKLAAESMRQYTARPCATAGAVPLLLRRCAGVARVAMRWGRAMHEARLQLAFSLRPDGGLSLKVANIPLRSVWEVTMRLELETKPHSVSWPRACDVKVTRVVSDIKITNEEIDKLLESLPNDWGHVPRAVWKIFRYLKNKTRDDELLRLS